jgi:hypothetical protein
MMSGFRPSQGQLRDKGSEHEPNGQSHQASRHPDHTRNATALPRDPESGKPETDALPSGVRFPLRELAPNASEISRSAQTP